MTLLWTREEALSRACKAGLHEHPEALREALHKHKHKLDDVSAAAQSLTVGGLVEALAATGAKIAAYAQDKVAALLPSLADPFLAASNAGASLSAQESSRSLAAMQAKLYGFDKLGVFLTSSGGVGGEPATLLAVDMSSETVFWVNELSFAGVDIGTASAATATIVRTDVDTISLVLSDSEAGTTIVDVALLTGEYTGSSLFLPSMHLQGMYPLSTALAQSLNNLGAEPDKTAAAGEGEDDASSSGAHTLLLEHSSSGKLGVAMYPLARAAATDATSSPVVGKFLSRVVDSSANSAGKAQFQTMRVLPSSSALASKCVDLGGSGAGAETGAAETCQVASVTMHDVEMVASSIFSSSSSAETVAAVAYQHPHDVVNNRAATLGDDSLLMKYLNPSTSLVVTEHTVPLGGNTTATTTTTTGTASQLEVHFLDTVSAKLLYRSSILNGASPVQAVVIENHLMISYWNSAMKRSELSSVALFEGMIDRQGLTPWANKGSAAIAQKHIDSNSFNSFSSPLPMAIQKTFVFPKTITAAGSTITQQGVAKKALVVGTSGGQLFSIDRQIINPRRPLENPTNAEKADGLFRYEPYLQLDNLAAPTHNYSMAFGPFLMTSAPSKLESSSVVLSLSRLDLHFNRVIPSLAFDLLSPDFNYPLLCIILAGLFALVVWMMRTLAARKKAKAWA